MIDESIEATIDQICQTTELEQKIILEIGCGGGRITSRLAQKSDAVYAIEPDAEKVALAQRSIPNANIQVGSGENLKFPDNHFDLVIFTLSLHHHDNRMRALQEAYRVTKPGGHILIIEPVFDGELEIVYSFVNNEEVVLGETQKTIQESGFTLGRDEIFVSNWIYEDAEEVCTDLFEAYSMEYDDQVAAQIFEFMGDKVNKKPVVLEDKLRAQVIRKE